MIDHTHKELNITTNETQQIKSLSEKNMKNMQTQEGSLNVLQYLNYIRQWTAHVEAKLDHLLDTQTQFTKIIINIREKKVQPAVITDNQLQEIINEIHKEVGEYEFALPSTLIKVENFHQIAKCHIGCD